MTRTGVLAVLLIGLLTACGPAEPNGTEVEPTNEGSTPGDVSISFPGPGPLATVVNAPSLAFGQQRVNTSATRTVTVSNTGSTVVRVSSMAISGSATFTLVSSTAPFDLAPGTARSLSVRFLPTALGTVTGTLTLTTNDPTTPNLSIALSGTGGKPILVLEPAMVNFGDQRVGTALASQPVRLRNTGTSPLTVTALSLSGASSFSFTSPSTPFTIAPNSLVELAVRFTPTLEGNITGSLQLTTNDPDYPSVSVALTGRGVRPILLVEPGLLDFGDQRVGTSSVRTLAIRNVGSGPITLNTLSMSGDPSFALASPMAPFTVMPGTNLNLQVSFNPVVEGIALTGSLQFTTNDPDYASVSVALSGRGVRPTLVVQPTMVHFGAQPVGTTSVRSVRLMNAGTGPLAFTALGVSGGPFFLNAPPAMPFMLHPGQFLDVLVSFSPTQVGPVNGTLVVSTSDAEYSSFAIALAGDGTSSALGLVLDVSSLDFGAQRVGTSGTRVVTATNAGSSPLFITSMSLTASAYPSFSSTTLPAMPFYLAPGSSLQLLVTFNPGAVGSVTGTLSLTTHDPLAPSTTLALSGYGVNTWLGGN